MAPGRSHGGPARLARYAAPMHPETIGSVCDDMGLREAAPHKGSDLAATLGES